MGQLHNQKFYSYGNDKPFCFSDSAIIETILAEIRVKQKEMIDRLKLLEENRCFPVEESVLKTSLHHLDIAEDLENFKREWCENSSFRKRNVSFMIL